MTLKEKYELDKKQRREDAENIRRATDYRQGYLVWDTMTGHVCDSGSRATNRMIYVVNAERKFVEGHVREILDLAADLCLAEIGEDDA